MKFKKALAVLMESKRTAMRVPAIRVPAVKVDQQLYYPEHYANGSRAKFITEEYGSFDPQVENIQQLVDHFVNK
jgi:hypothetical protein